MSGEHHVQRPGWRCATDGEDWPCASARKLLTGAYTDPTALAVHLGSLMARAAADLGVAKPADLYRRFLA